MLQQVDQSLLDTIDQLRKRRDGLLRTNASQLKRLTDLTLKLDVLRDSDMVVLLIYAYHAGINDEYDKLKHLARWLKRTTGYPADDAQHAQTRDMLRRAVVVLGSDDESACDDQGL